MKRDLYNMPKLLERTVKRIRDSDKLSEKNKKLIFEFQRHLVLNNAGIKRINKLLGSLPHIALALNKDFDKATKRDVENYIQKLQERDYKPLTKSNYKTILKKFYKWLKGNDVKFPEEVEWIKTTLKRTDKHLPGEADLITEEEIKKLISSAEHPRDKAIVSVLYESGCRVSELGSLSIKDVKFDKYGALIHVNGKTGPRTIRLISSVPFLSTWINNHPSKDERDSALWICVGSKNHNNPIHYPVIYFMLKRIFKKVGIKKRFNPHLFRHSRATFLANHLTEFQMNQYFGWVQGSNMPATYIHMSGKNVEGAILELNGIKSDKEETKESSLKPKKCPRCDKINSFDSRFCDKCAYVLDIKTMIELESDLEQGKVKLTGERALDLLVNDKWLRKMFIKKMGEVKV